MLLVFHFFGSPTRASDSLEELSESQRLLICANLPKLSLLTKCGAILWSGSVPKGNQPFSDFGNVLELICALLVHLDNVFNWHNGNILKRTNTASVSCLQVFHSYHHRSSRKPLKELRRSLPKQLRNIPTVSHELAAATRSFPKSSHESSLGHPLGNILEIVMTIRRDHALFQPTGAEARL